ncbi:hypothetical protein HDV01_006038 [Terramyces sp. JEL0728]|nr:hypothetical protein HDV01_006038 [Terramyces sp. JEL0728]
MAENARLAELRARMEYAMMKAYLGIELSIQELLVKEKSRPVAVYNQAYPIMELHPSSKSIPYSLVGVSADVLEATRL